MIVSKQFQVLKAAYSDSKQWRSIQQMNKRELVNLGFGSNAFWQVCSLNAHVEFVHVHLFHIDKVNSQTKKRPKNNYLPHLWPAWQEIQDLPDGAKETEIIIWIVTVNRNTAASS